MPMFEVVEIVFIVTIVIQLIREYAFTKLTVMLSTTSGQPMTIVTLLIISNNKHTDSSGASVGAGSAEHLTESRDGHVRSRDLKHQSQAAQRVM